MTILEMLGQSGVLAVLGMGIVFSFLLIMVISVTCLGGVVRALGLNKDGRAQAAGGGQASGVAKTTAVTAAITAAVTEYHKNNS